MTDSVNRTVLILCFGSSCFARGNKKMLSRIQFFLEKHQLADKVEFKGHHCLNECSKGPNIMIGDQIIGGISEDNIEEILERELLKNV
jgi:NADH:ubiquinone oxidoreductase subunit E